MHIELVPGGEQMLKHCLANDKIATEDWNWWVHEFMEGNSILWMAFDRESECPG
jgi:hypothetical protein